MWCLLPEIQENTARSECFLFIRLRKIIANFGAYYIKSGRIMSETKNYYSKELFAASSDDDPATSGCAYKLEDSYSPEFVSIIMKKVQAEINRRIEMNKKFYTLESGSLYVNILYLRCSQCYKQK